jgi:hypothetical protein
MAWRRRTVGEASAKGGKGARQGGKGAIAGCGVGSDGLLEGLAVFPKLWLYLTPIILCGSPSKEHIQSIKLRYIIIQQYRNTIRQNYIYFGEMNTKELIETKEGTLHRISEKELLNREYTKIYMEMMKHYINAYEPEERIIMGIVGTGGLS